MSQWIQYAIVGVMVAGAGVYVARGLLSTLRTGKGAGSCCSKGCGGAGSSQNKAPGSHAGGPSTKDASGNGVVREVFFPSELLYRKRR